MKIAFSDVSPFDFHVQTPDTAPLGGSHSAACYLARALARRGHEVSFFSNTTTPGVYDGVNCISWANIPPTVIAHAFICLLAANHGKAFRQSLGPHTRLIFWTGHATDQPAVQNLRDAPERDAYDGYAMISEWQRREFAREFAIDPARMAVLRYAPAPCFLNQFGPSEPILPHKTWPPILAYTSTPYRGLLRLLDAFPHIRAAIPGARLQVFSSMQVYQVSSADDQEQYGQLYQRCRQMEGVEYVGSKPQPELAKSLRNVAVLAYPNIFAETSCIAVLEAMASGCRIVTTDLGALPETTAGFANLIPMKQRRDDYIGQFIKTVTAVLNEIRQGDGNCESLLRRQVNFANEKSSWDDRAREWEQWLEGIVRQ